MKAKSIVLMVVFFAMAFPFHLCAASNVTVSGGITAEVRYTPENGWHGCACMQLQGFVSSEGANMQCWQR